MDAIEPVLGLEDLAEEPKDRQFITALARGLEVLRAFRPGDGPLGNLELANRTGLPRPTISRITYTLTALGYLEHLPKWEKYRPAAPCIGLGYAYLSGLELRTVARRHMQELANALDCSVALCARDRLSVTYVELCRGPGNVTLRLEVGARLPMARSVTGLAFLVALPETERRFLQDAIRRRAGAEWTKIRRLIAEAERLVRERGFYAAEGVYERDINAAAVPFSLPGEGALFVMNCTGPTFEMPRERLEKEVGPRLLHMVGNIKAEFARHRSWE